VSIVFYHRVADNTPNDWTISNRQFARQIDWLEKHFDLVSLEEAQHRIRHGNTRPAVSLTFDDGYSENCEQALPLLVKRQLPCTYFVTSHNVLTGEPFPHDAQAQRPLAPNTIEQLRSLVAAGIEIGAHTRTHADLGAITDEAELRGELLGSRDDLQDSLGATVRYFVFPYGLHANLNRRAFHLAREAAFAGVCSAYGGYNTPGDDPFHLQRIHGDPDFVPFRNWLTFDRRKIAQVERYEYQERENAPGK
jgi:peptidoglycan/xylan/chitin deacetylase (PgdA/CDA1 family)